MPKVSRRFAAAESAAPVGYTPPANPEADPLREDIAICYLFDSSIKMMDI